MTNVWMLRSDEYEAERIFVVNASTGGDARRQVADQQPDPVTWRDPKQTECLLLMRTGEDHMNTLLREWVAAKTSRELVLRRRDNLWHALLKEDNQVLHMVRAKSCDAAFDMLGLTLLEAE